MSAASMRTVSHPRHELDEPGLSASQVLPGRDGVGAVEEHRGRDERFVIGERHPGVVGVRGGWKLRQDPDDVPARLCGAGRGRDQTPPDDADRRRSGRSCRSRRRCESCALIVWAS